MGLELFVENLGKALTFVNVYWSYQERVQFWDALLGRSFIRQREVIMGGI